MTTTLEETPECVASPPPVRPIYAAGSAGPQGLVREPVALDAMMHGVSAAAAVFVGLALFGIALAYAPAMTGAVLVLLMVIGAALLAIGLAYVASVDPKAA
jgi:hypothetical protein